MRIQPDLTCQPVSAHDEISTVPSTRFVRAADVDVANAAEVDDGLDEHFGDVAGAILDGDVVPVLGAGVNLCDRADDERWERGQSLPSGRELAAPDPVHRTLVGECG